MMNALARPRNDFYEDMHAQFRETIRRFAARHIIPHIAEWEQAGLPPRSFWRACGEAGLLCPQIAVQWGGPGLDFSFNAVIAEELGYLGLPPGLLVHSDIVADYIARYGNDEQRARWLPGMVSGDIVGAIAMTEPQAGSDLQGMRAAATREGDHYRLNGAKTYITNGLCADIVIVAARTDAEAGARGIGLLVVENGMAGFERGRALDKIGQHSGDTAELFFHDVPVPAANLLGREGGGFAALMESLPQERLAIAIMAQASAQRAFDEAVAYTRERRAFGQRVLDLQNTRFVLADLKAQLQVGWAHIDMCIKRHLDLELDSAAASAAKLWHTELQWKCCDTALQLHGGAGYMNEYAIARLWKDSRLTRIFGGTSEIMKEIIGRRIG